MNVAVRFWNKTANVGNLCECWFWLAAKNHRGYGQFKYNGTMKQAHRVSYEITIGKIPDGMQLDHLCRNRDCVNPYHLEPVTGAENTARGNSGKLNKIKTHCKRGHEFNKENTYLHSHGKYTMRACKACERTRRTGNA